jgi:hypothetical protein
VTVGEIIRWLALAFLVVMVVGSSLSLVGRVGSLRAPAAPGVNAPALLRANAGGNAPHQAPSASNDTWNNLSALSSFPDARILVAMASDPALGGIVLFGGCNSTSSAGFSDTWLFSNGSWSDIGAPFLSTPPARWGASMAFDPADGYLVLFGGRNASALYSDTWVLSATAARSWAGWSHLTPISAPSARAFATAFYDPVSSSVVLFGGGCVACGTGSANWLANNETWSYSGGAWTNESSTAGTSPGTLMTGYAAWDPSLGGGVYFGGQYSSNNCTSPRTTWLYRGTWTKLTTNGTPSLAVDGGMAWYAPENELVLFGGLQRLSGGCAADNETAWVLQDYNWTDVTNGTHASSLLGPRWCIGAAYDPYGQVVVVFGGDS